jgi:DNA-binding NarL/FixJ family response regulator
VPRRVLIIEDHLSVLASIQRLLTEQGFEVCAATSLREGLEKLDGQAHDVTIIDLHLPDGLGTVILRKIRQMNTPTRAVIWTASQNAAALAEAESLGPDAIFFKADPEKLLEWLRDGD